MTLTVTGNASKDTFNLIKDNPYGYTHSTAAKKLIEHGYKSTSVHSLITQMKKAGILSADNDGMLYTTQAEYKPFANPYKSKPVGRKARGKPTSAGIAALKVDTAQAAPATPAKLDAETILANIGIKEAHKLYMELSKMFGGAR